MIITPHGLILIEDDEHPSWLAHYNVSIQKIDVALSEQDSEIATATTLVNTAITTATGAVTTANEAKTLATSAIEQSADATTTANNAVTIANAASTEVQGAITAAAQASGKADAATQLANEVYTLAAEANGTSQLALSTAGSAQSAANAASTAAATADGKAVAANTAANGANTNALAALNNLSNFMQAFNLTNKYTGSFTVHDVTTGTQISVTVPNNFLTLASSEDGSFFKAWNIVYVGASTTLRQVELRTAAGFLPNPPAAMYEINNTGLSYLDYNQNNSRIYAPTGIRVYPNGQIGFICASNTTGNTYNTFSPSFYINADFGDIIPPVGG